jgi:hypothetical protein
MIHALHLTGKRQYPLRARIGNVFTSFACMH